MIGPVANGELSQGRLGRFVHPVTLSQGQRVKRPSSINRFAPARFSRVGKSRSTVRQTHGFRARWRGSTKQHRRMSRSMAAGMHFTSTLERPRLAGSSTIGSASIRDAQRRCANRGVGLAVDSTDTPVWSDPSTTFVTPAARNALATVAAVRGRSYTTRGFWCRSRRNASGFQRAAQPVFRGHRQLPFPHAVAEVACWHLR